MASRGKKLANSLRILGIARCDATGIAADQTRNSGSQVGTLPAYNEATIGFLLVAEKSLSVNQLSDDEQ